MDILGTLTIVGMLAAFIYYCKKTPISASWGTHLTHLFYYFIVTAVIFGISAGINQAQAADISYNQEKAEIYFEGKVTIGDAKKLRSFLVDLIEEEVTLYADSNGGNAYEGLLMNDLLEAHGNVKVIAYNCQSSCANMAIAAKGIRGILYFHKARFTKNAEMIATPQSYKKLEAGNQLIIEECWKDRLTDQQIEYILKRESRTKLIGVRFKDF